MFTVLPLPAFNDNYIWMLTSADHPGMVVVDPGDADVVIKAVNDSSIPLVAILLTHHHPDHTGGVKQLVDLFSVPVYGPANSPFKEISQPLTDGMQISILGKALVIKEIPGHTLDHISYYLADETSQIFCGDTLFLAGCGRLFEGSPQQMLSNMDYFKTLPLNTQVYCTHEYSLANLAFAHAVEPTNADISNTIVRCEELRSRNLPTLPSSIGQELKINPFMRAEICDVQNAASNHTKSNINNQLDAFTAIREWKNSF